MEAQHIHWGNPARHVKQLVFVTQPKFLFSHTAIVFCQKLVEAITSMSEDFAQWYTDVVVKADLTGYTSVKGFMVLKPAGYAIWELIQKQLDAKFKETGVENGDTAERILCALGFMPVRPVVVKNRKILRNEDISVCLDDVQCLGAFLEIEIMVESEENRTAALSRIEKIIESIGYTMADTTRMSYLSQLQNKAKETQRS